MISNNSLLTISILSMLAISMAAFNSVDAATRGDIKRIIVEEARESRVPTALALAVAKVESNFDESALSHAGARGVMQIMPTTARDVFGIHKDELWNARLNVQIGIDYLEQLYKQYKDRWDLALSHYNGGSLNSTDGTLYHPHEYTKKYVADVMKWRSHYAEQARIWQVAGDPTDIDNLDNRLPGSDRAVDLVANARNIKDGLKSELELAPVRQIIVRKIPDHEYTKYAEIRPLNKALGNDLRRRLIKARRNLDDFAGGGTVVRWYEG